MKLHAPESGVTLSLVMGTQLDVSNRNLLLKIVKARGVMFFSKPY